MQKTRLFVLASLFFISVHSKASVLDTVIIKETPDVVLKLIVPSFLIAGENIELQSIIYGKKKWTGYLTLECKNAVSKQNVDGLFHNVFPNQYFSISEKDSVLLFFPIAIPYRFGSDVLLCLKMYNGEILIGEAEVSVTIKGKNE